MKNLFKSLILILFLPALVFAAGANENLPKDEALTLSDCYKLALKQSEIIAIDAEQIKIAQAHFLQAFGTLLPQVSFSADVTRQNSNSDPSSNRNFEHKFIFKQALFTGFKEFAQISGSKFERKQRENEIIRAKQLLFVDVSDAFYLLIELREDLKTLDVIQKAFMDRIEELKNREKLGKSRASEVVSTETQAYSLEDEIESVRSQESIAAELLEFLIGKPPRELAERDFDYSLKAESEYVAKASSRTDVQAAHLAWQVDKTNITVARSGLLPAVNLEGDYYTHRTSSPRDSKWEALLSIDVPIFEGTTTFGQVKEAVSNAKESGLLFARSGRLAIQDIHDSYVNAHASFARVGLLDKALKSAERNYELQTEDYKLGIVNNIDVLAAIQNLENIRRTFNHISYESKRFYWQLQAASSDINVN